MNTATRTHPRRAQRNHAQRLVVYCDGTGDFEQRVLSWLPAHARLDLHVIRGGAGRRDANPTVQVRSLPNLRRHRWTEGETRAAQGQLSKCGPGSTGVVLARYGERTAASLMIVPAGPARLFARWWSESLVESLARHIPVLAIPSGYVFRQPGEQRPLRWLVPLDGSPTAEAILDPLRSISSWLPSELLLLQPLLLASLWRQRVAASRASAKMGPSIADSWSYLAGAASQCDLVSLTRACCTTDADPVGSIARLANSPSIDAVALGLSDRWRFTRMIAAELSELLHAKLRKPVLILRSTARHSAA